MNTPVFSKVLLALIVHSCSSAIVIQTPKPHLTRVYEAGMDILMTCYRDQFSTLGIAGDSDGSVIRALASEYFIPIVLTDVTYSIDNFMFSPWQHSLNVFIIAIDSETKFQPLMLSLRATIWWNYDAKFIILDTSPDPNRQCRFMPYYLYMTNVRFGLIDTLVICIRGNILMFDVNPFAPYAPKTWKFERTITTDRTFHLFIRGYQKGGRNCEDLNFSKTTDLGHYQLHLQILEPETYVAYRDVDKYNEMVPNISYTRKVFNSIIINDHKWIVNTIRIGLNATVIVNDMFNEDKFNGGKSNWATLTFNLIPDSFSNPIALSQQYRDKIIFSYFQLPFFAITQHTAHKSQLEKILTVTDEKCRIGMLVVYVVTFLFFKFFLRQAIVPAILNLVRLTCGTGLVRLPQNVAPTIYLACLFAFVVTLQAIYTGNLASLLTTVIAYPHVNMIQDIERLGYTLYVAEDIYSRFAGHPNVEGRVIKMPSSDMRVTMQTCTEHILSNPLVACIMEYVQAVVNADKWDLHISRDPLLVEYLIYHLTENNPLKRRLEALMLSGFENGSRLKDHRITRLLHQFVDDAAVQKNVERRVMNLNDLKFAFVILIVGLACSLICFISELVVFRVRLKIAKRRERARVRLAWAPTKRNWFSSLSFRLNARRLFSRRR